MAKAKKHSLIAEYATYFCKKHSATHLDADCDDCDTAYGILRDFYNETLYNAAQEIRYKQNNCAGECAEDLELMCEDYD